MRRHAFSQLTARAENGGIRIAFYFTTPVFESLPADRPPPPVRIHRQCATHFTWGQDYAEYFDGADVAQARIIFEGPLEPINKRKFEFLDEKVAIGGTYMYWASSPLGRLPTGPVAVRFRDRRIWWPQEEITARLNAIAQAHPSHAAVQKFGATVGGRAVPGLRVGNRDCCLALIGAVHAGESGPELMIPLVERLLQNNADLLAQVGVALLPSVNIDERERLVQGCPWYLRTNSRGVDLNRNFNAEWQRVAYGYGLISSDPDSMTYRGPKPESEPETRAVVKFLKTVRPAAVLAYHHLASITGACFLAPHDAQDDSAYRQTCAALVEPFVAAFYPGKKWRAGFVHGTSTGSLPAYAYHKLGIPGFDLEWDGNPDAQLSLRDETTPEMIAKYQDRHYRGLLAMLQACRRRNRRK